MLGVSFENVIVFRDDSQSTSRRKTLGVGVNGAKLDLQVDKFRVLRCYFDEHIPFFDLSVFV